jgi:hypothetical protein
MILAITILGLSISLTHDACYAKLERPVCLWPLRLAFDKNNGPRTVRYFVFLGAYGMLISTIGTVALYIEGFPSIVPLVADSIGTLCLLAGGIAWMVNMGGNHCHAWKVADWNKINWGDLPVDADRLKDADGWAQGVAVSACMQAEAAHGLTWVLFAVTASLLFCDYFRRRDLAISAR